MNESFTTVERKALEIKWEMPVLWGRAGVQLKAFQSGSNRKLGGRNGISDFSEMSPMR